MQILWQLPVTWSRAPAFGDSAWVLTYWSVGKDLSKPMLSGYVVIDPKPSKP